MSASIIERIYALDEHESRCLYSAGGAEIRQYRQYRWLNLDGSLIQSLMDLEQPGKLLNPVNTCMLSALVFTGPPRRVLNLGFGGGGFERFFRQYFPGTVVDSVEVDETVIHLAREYFGIAADYPVYLQAAGDFVARSDGHYELILCDIFNRENHPDCLYETGFYSDCQQRLSGNGLMVLNLVPDDERDLMAILLPLRQSFGHVSLSRINGHDNVLVFAAQAAVRPMAGPELLAQLGNWLGIDVGETLAQLQPLPPA